ncbi:helix-turn-helix domain-containing protein [Nocardia sp. NRRL S-836]|uniref:helix-turn-helix domain-containing protein n=1 Tax=Nocardia sp. NRRL S-836 TaxID=1519492 RepID=UPI0006ADC151|nr:helix-turn-helix transcriptional regulator [Nocardia sp. NRRL S-836]KOV84666.1 XRE family transcriptional regulator [Nocardia sp. NRRL S-836]
MPQPISENLARLRMISDISQEALAEASGVGVDTISRIERGERQTVRRTTVAKLAAALEVPPAVLLGLEARPDEQYRDQVADLRCAITASAEIPGLADFAETDEVATAEAVSDDAHHAWRAYVGGDHGTLLHILPTLLIDARRRTHHTSGDANAVAQRVLSTAYRLGAGVAGRFGLDDLAWTSAERAIEAARRSDAVEMETAVSLRYLVWTLVRQGRTEDAERVAVRSAAGIEPRMLDRDPVRAGVFGNLIFNAASAALRSGNSRRAEDLLAVAHSAAVRSGRDMASEAAIFGPRVAAFQLVDHAMRLGDPETALRLADRIPQASGAVPAFWEAGHRLHLAHAATQIRQDHRALGYLAQARQIAPDWVRRQPLGKTTMSVLVDRATRRKGKEFAALAVHYGVVNTRTK